MLLVSGSADLRTISIVKESSTGQYGSGERAQIHEILRKGNGAEREA